MFFNLNRMVFSLKELSIPRPGLKYVNSCYDKLFSGLCMMNNSISTKERNPLLLLQDITIIKLLLDNQRVFEPPHISLVGSLSKTNRFARDCVKHCVMDLHNEMNATRDKFVKFLNYRPWLKEFLELIDISISEENVEQRLVTADEIIVFLTKFLDILNALNTETIETRTTQSSYIDFRLCPIFCNAFAEMQQQIDKAILSSPEEVYNEQFKCDLVQRLGVVFYPYKVARYKRSRASHTFATISSRNYRVKPNGWSPGKGLETLQQQNGTGIWEPELHPKLAIALAAILPQIRHGYCIRTCSYYLFLQYLMRFGISPVGSYDGYDLDGPKLHVVIKSSTNVKIYFHVNAPIIDIQPIEYLALQHDATVGPLPEAVFPQIKEIREQHGLQGNTRRVAEKSFYSFRAEFSLKYNTDNGRVIFSTRACGLHDYTKSRDASPYGTMFSQLLILHPELSALKSDSSIQSSTLTNESLTTQRRNYSRINTYVYRYNDSGEIRYVVNIVLPNGARKQFVMFFCFIAGADKGYLMFDSQVTQAPDFILNTAAATTTAITREGDILRHFDRLYFTPIHTRTNLFSNSHRSGDQVDHVSQTTNMIVVHRSKTPSDNHRVYWLKPSERKAGDLLIKSVNITKIFPKPQYLKEVELLVASTRIYMLMIRVSATDPTKAEIARLPCNEFHNNAKPWETHTLRFDFAFKVLTANNELFVSGGETNMIYSHDGMNWWLCEMQLEGCCQHLLWDKQAQRFIAIGNIGSSTNNYVITSKDGMNWIKVGTISDVEIIEVVIFDDLLYITMCKNEKLVVMVMTIEQLQRRSHIRCTTLLCP